MATTNWAIDPAHSEISFKVKHLLITTVTGKFTDFSATVESANEDFSDAKISFSANVASVNTSNDMRDGHLKGEDFFNAEAFPTLTFEGKKMVKKDDEYALEGDLTIRDVTKSVSFEVEFNGVQTDPWGNVKAGFELEGKIKRKDFGLTWDALTEAGGAVVSDDVKIQCHIQLVKQA